MIATKKRIKMLLLGLMAIEIYLVESDLRLNVAVYVLKTIT